MSKVCSGPRLSSRSGLLGGARLKTPVNPKNLISALAWICLFFGVATAQSQAPALVQPVGVTSPVQTATLTFTATGTFGSIAVLTQGASNLDFTDAGGTCAVNTAYSVGQTCTVKYAFTPTHPGIRYGGITLATGAGVLLANGYITGTGTGPQVNWSPGVQIALGSGLNGPGSVAVDGSGNIFVADGNNNLVKEILAAGGYTTINTLGSGFHYPYALAVDGSGNVFVGDVANNAVKEILAAGGYTTVRTVGSGFGYPYGIAVDGSGNVFVADTGRDAIFEVVAVNGSIPASPAINQLGSGFREPTGVAVDGNGNVFVADDVLQSIYELPVLGGYATVIKLASSDDPTTMAVDASGDLFFSDDIDNTVSEIVAVNGSIPTSPTINKLGSGFIQPYGIAVDGSGNVFVADSKNNRVVKLDYADPPSLTFAATNVGSISGPQTVTITNGGNENLIFSVPASGTNPSITPGFTIANTPTCPQLTTFSSAATLAPGVSCTNIVSFAPVVSGPDSGTLVPTDNNLNVTGATQVVPLNGVGAATTLPPVVTSVTPTSGPVAGGTVVTITGTSFTGATAVNFGSTAATNFTVVSDNSITATTPAGTGAVDVTVTTPNGTSPTSPADLFTYVVPLAQTITFTQPAAAYAGTAVLLSATGGASGNPVVFSVISGPAVVSGTNGSTLTYTGAGSVVVEADQAATPLYLAAPPVRHTVTTTILTEPLATPSPAVPTLVTFNSAGTLGVITGLTQGKPNQDFSIVPGGDCAIGTTYGAGQTCTVDFTFTPSHPGLRDGAVLLTTTAGATLANGYVYGVGNGPQVVWSPGTQTTLGSGSGIGSPTGVAIDGNGNIFVADMANNSVEEILASNGSVITLGTFPLPDDVAVDGSGNVFVISNRTTLSELPPSTAACPRRQRSSRCTPTSTRSTA
jgi:sugar lactone lactonase YvrE